MDYSSMVRDELVAELESRDQLTADLPKCDECEKPAVVNYQDCFVAYDIIGGKYEQRGVANDTGGDNEHYCEEHDQSYGI